MTKQPLDTSAEKKLFDIAYWLAIFTIVYNLIEGFIATILGYEDETLALFGFGLDRLHDYTNS